MNKKMLLMLAMGSMSVGSAFAMYMDRPSALSLRQWLAGEISTLASDVDITRDIVSKPLDAKFQDATSHDEQISAELGMYYGRYKLQIAQLNFGCMKCISDYLNGDLNLGSADPVLREQRRVAFNQFAEDEQQKTRAMVARIQSLCQQFNNALNAHDIRAQQALLAKIRPQSASGNNNTGPSTDMKSFFANNRNYIAGVAITAAVVGTIYFYGHRIKAWITGKPVQEKQAFEVVK